MRDISSNNFWLFPGTLLPGMITRYCALFYLHENQIRMSFTKWINDKHVINFKQLLAKNLTIQILCATSRLSNLWITIPSSNWREIFTTSWFFVSFLFRLYLLPANVHSPWTITNKDVKVESVLAIKEAYQLLIGSNKTEHFSY